MMSLGRLDWRTLGGPSRARWLVLVVVGYILIYSALLFAGKGYPYGLDNNESYSSWWHARSLYENGVGQTKGLTDEVFSTDPDASPYIHSHQGNFPRLFTFVVYAFGFRSIESHILISTFTVGLAAILLAFRFLAELTRPAFATVACLVMMTNYLLFAQWQVSLYNVWHAFFFFSSLRCIQLLGPWSARRKRWLLLSTANFAALFYWEYVSTAFLTVLCAIYAVSLYWRRPALVALAAGAVAAGALLAAGTLLIQLTAYMGWSNVLEDIRLTLTARNTASDPAILERVTTFYREQKIIFWHNFLDAGPLRTPAEFWNSIGRHHLAYYSGPLAASMLTVFLAGIVIWLRQWIPWMPPKDHDAASSNGLTVSAGATAITGLVWLTLSGVLVGILDVAGPPFDVLSMTAAGGFAAAVLTLLLGRVSLGSWWGWGQLNRIDVLSAGVFVILASLCVAWLKPLVTSPETELGYWSWTGLGGTVLRLGSAALSAWWILQRAPAGGSSRIGDFNRLFVLIIGALIAYAFTYRIFTGYVFSGYLHRLVPLLVFATDLVLALVVYLAGKAAQNLWFASREATAIRPQRIRAGGVVAVTVLLGLFVFQWATVQLNALFLVRPDSFGFLKVLDAPALRGKSIVANTYPAPMVARTQSWGYADTVLFTGLVTLGPDGYQVDRDLKYLWFADQATNPSYLKPDLAVSVAHPPNVAEAWQRRLEQAERKAEGLPRIPPGVARRAQAPFQPFLQHEMVYTDHERVDIVRLDWDFPPFLGRRSEEIQALGGQLTLAQKLALSRSASETRRRWRVEWRWLDESSSPVAGLLSIWCDDREIAIPSDAVTAVPHGDRLRIRVSRAEGRSRLRVTVNESSEVIDLSALPEQGVEFNWEASTPLGRHARSAAFAPGFYVSTRLVSAPVSSDRIAELSYNFQHQSNREEAGTVIRRYTSTTPGTWQISDKVRLLGQDRIPIRIDQFRRENPDTVAEHTATRLAGDTRSYEQWLAAHLAANPAELARVGIARDVSLRPPESPGGATVVQFRLGPTVDGSIQFSVAPGTQTKEGPEYFGLPFRGDALTADNSLALVPPAVDEEGAPPYGRMRLRLRFPVDRWPQAEPILTTGGNEAGDILYVIYQDANHIRIGLDHWFKGGPLTAPIRIEHGREYEMEISLGSLYPPVDDVVFADQTEAQVAALKQRIVVRLDGTTIIEAESDFYESDPAQVKVGRNEIGATSCGPLFTGEVTQVERLWPELQ